MLWTNTTNCALPPPAFPPTVTPVTATDASPPSQGSTSRLKLEPSAPTSFRLVVICVTSFGHEGKREPSASSCFQLSESRSMFTSKNAIELAGAA